VTSGVSIAEYLKVMALLIIPNGSKQMPKLRQPSRYIAPKRYQESKLDLIDRALLGVTVLSSQSDEALTEQFLYAYMEMSFEEILGNSTQYSKVLTNFHIDNTFQFLQDTLGFYVRDTSKVRAQDTLGVCVRETPEVRVQDVDSGLSCRPQSAASLISYRSNFAPSLTSSSFSSFAKMGRPRSSILFEGSDDDAVDSLSNRLSLASL
jgi:hypothetical protein